MFVLGAGPAGYTAAILAAKKGLRVGIAEGSRLGGTCTNTGCIPAKTYIESVNLLARIKGASKFAIETGNPKLDFVKLKARKDRIVTRLSKGIEYLLKQHGVEVFGANASIQEPGSIKAGDVLMRARNTIIATGASPKMLPLPGLQDSWTSNEIFGVTTLPRSLAIIGGGVIGMEMAHIFSSLDVKVTVIEALDRILPLEDRHVSDTVARLFRKVEIFTSARVTHTEGHEQRKIFIDTPAGTKTVDAEKILLSIGRQPVLPAGGGEIGLALTPSGGIGVDEYMHSSVPGVYAVGDVTGNHMYAYVASREASIAVDHITGGSKKMSYRNIPSIIFTDPEVASVGDVKAENRTSEKLNGRFPLSALGRARTMEAHEGYAHVVSDSGGVIERISIVAPHATELISWAALAVDQGLNVTEFLDSYCPHPVLAEILKEAAEEILGISVHHVS